MKTYLKTASVGLATLMISAIALAQDKGNAPNKESAATKFTGATVNLDNGIAGDGHWTVDAGNGCDSRTGSIDPTGATGLSDVIYDFFTYVDPGADGGGMQINETTIDSAVASSGAGQVMSQGHFTGPNGTINWSATCSIAPSSLIYQVDLSFSSASPFGTVRIVNYLDEDVLGSGNDILVVFGTPGNSNFQLLTADNTENVGVSHSAGYNSGTNATYIGWAADEYSDLRSAITGSGASYSVPGNVDTVDLPLISDARYPGQDVYGPNDITSALAFDLNPSATSASVSFALGGSPNAQPPQPPAPPTPAGPIPSLGTWALALLGLLLLVLAIPYHRRTGNR